MKIIDASFEILTPINREEIIKDIERIGRTCYKSEDKITNDSATDFVKLIITRGHESVLEHKIISVKFICDRGVSHEIVRHRIASYAQESTRYCNYSKDKFGNEITVIEPLFFKHEDISSGDTCKRCQWEKAMKSAEKWYFSLLKEGASAQEARSVLPNSLKTEIVVTMNLREWRYFLKLRTSEKAHPQMRELTVPLLNTFKEYLPEIFNDIIL